MAWYRPHSLAARLAPYVVGAVTLALLALGAYVALQQYGARRYEAGRASLMQESHDWLKASNGAWRRVAAAARHDTVRALDTVLVTRIVQAKATARNVSEIAKSEHQPSEVLTGDTQHVPVAPDLGVALRACGAQLDSLANDCDRFRASALAALAAKDSVIDYKERDSKALAVLARGAIVDRDRLLYRAEVIRERCFVGAGSAFVLGGLLGWKVAR